MEGRAGGRELTWAAPWGTGFPGWHTECSAMSLHYLGDTIDIHTGGIDLRFPHHEDERAQSNAVTGHEVVRHWVHGEHLLFEGRKMAKSTGNVVLLGDLAERGLDPLALRLAFLEHRYRQQMNLTWDTLEAADATLRRWRERVADWANSPSMPMCAQYAGRLHSARSTTTWTPRRRCGRCARWRRTPRSRRAPSSRRSPTATGSSASTWPATSAAGRRGRRCPTGRPRGCRPARGRPRGSDWPASDRLRAELAALGVTVTDTPAGQAWAGQRPCPDRWDHATICRIRLDLSQRIDG